MKGDTNMLNASELKSGLAQFTGTEEYHRLTLARNLVFTDGCRWLADNADAYWLMTLIMSYQMGLASKPALREFQVWKLTAKDGKAVATCDDGNDKVHIRQEIPFTDFPLDEIKLYVELGSLDGVNPCLVCMLPSER